MALKLRGKSRARRDADAGSNDAIRPKHTEVINRQMRGTPLASGIAIASAEELSEHPRRIGAFGQAMSVASVGGDDRIIGPQC
jgi:hypothetical protein